MRRLVDAFPLRIGEHVETHLSSLYGKLAVARSMHLI